ncbi:MAG TPA: serine hydrolase domain-containing protein [Roseateles sp.]|nr:serine hydrolase domain-containing protein [Roseateles sp.]
MPDRDPPPLPEPPFFQRRRLLAAPLLMSLPGLGRAAPAEDLRARLQTLVEDPERPLASLSVLVLRAGRVAFEAQFGRRWIDPADSGKDLPATRDTLYRIASVSKLIAALAVLRLVEAGRLDLDADISEALGYALRHPGFPRQPLSIRLLLSHRSGLRDAGGAYLGVGQTLASKLLEGGAHFGRGESWSPAAEPGRYFEYCNLNYGVLASVMERATDQRFDALMREQVLAPLAMRGGFEASQFDAAELAQLATLYRKRATDDDAPWHTAGPWVVQTDDWRGRRPLPPAGLDGYELGSNGSLFGPQGRLRTRVADLGTVLAMLAEGGRHEGRSFLKPASVALLCSEQWRLDADAANGDSLAGLFQAWGLGVQHFIDRSVAGRGDRLLPQGGQQAWGHLGFAYGLHSGLLLDPAARSGIAYAIGGTGADPARQRGRYSSFPLWEERLQALLWAAARGEA